MSDVLTRVLDLVDQCRAAESQIAHWKQATVEETQRHHAALAKLSEAEETNKKGFEALNQANNEVARLAAKLTEVQEALAYEMSDRNALDAKVAELQAMVAGREAEVAKALEAKAEADGRRAVLAASWDALREAGDKMAEWIEEIAVGPTASGKSGRAFEVAVV